MEAVFRERYREDKEDIGKKVNEKIAAIASRGTKRDFVDLYFICKETGEIGKLDAT